MSRYVVDASMAIKWFLPEIHSEAVLRLRHSRYRLHVPALMTLELGTVLAKRIRRGELTRAEGDVVLKELKQLPLQRHRVLWVEDLPVDVINSSASCPLRLSMVRIFFRSEMAGVRRSGGTETGTFSFLGCH